MKRRYLIEWGHLYVIVEVEAGMGQHDRAIQKAFADNGVPREKTVVTITPLQYETRYVLEQRDWSLLRLEDVPEGQAALPGEPSVPWDDNDPINWLNQEEMGSP